jgi:hypothetical protein
MMSSCSAGGDGDADGDGSSSSININEWEPSLDAFYQWLVQWQRGVTERSVLEQEWTSRLVVPVAPAPSFSWCDANGKLWNTSRNSNTDDWKSAMVYGSGASWLTLRVELTNPILLQVVHQAVEAVEVEAVEAVQAPVTTPLILVTAQVWTTILKEDTTPQEVTAKQVTAWMQKKEPMVMEPMTMEPMTMVDQQDWRLVHLHETHIQGHGPLPGPGPGPGPTRSTVVNPPNTLITPTSTTAPAAPWTSQPSTAAAAAGGGGGGGGSIPSRRRHIHANLERFQAKPLLWNGTIVGISIAGWDIGTSQGPIGDAHWFQQALEELEPSAQYNYKDNKGVSSSSSTTTTTTTTIPQRQLALPEMVFPLAHVVLERRQRGDLFVSWDAMDGLKEWAQAHQAIPLPSSSAVDNKNKNSNTNNNDDPTPPISFRGVSVLQTSDASLWKRKRQQEQQQAQAQGEHTTTTTTTYTTTNKNKMEDSAAAAAPVIPVGATTFHYDWTYSSPFCGKVYGGVSGGGGWTKLKTSGMPLHLLTDQSVPILYFDQLVLVEDDLHDNGLCQWTVKVRVMPTCAYILSQLHVRVDHVVVRVRDTRLLVEFATHTLYRDVTWRECAWEDLAAHQLPTDVRAWTHEHDVAEPATALAQLQQRLPVVNDSQLPRDIYAHAKLSYAATSSSSAAAATTATATAKATK